MIQRRHMHQQSQHAHTARREAEALSIGPTSSSSKFAIASLRSLFDFTRANSVSKPVARPDQFLAEPVNLLGGVDAVIRQVRGIGPIDERIIEPLPLLGVPAVPRAVSEGPCASAPSSDASPSDVGLTRLM